MQTCWTPGLLVARSAARRSASSCSGVRQTRVGISEPICLSLVQTSFGFGGFSALAAGGGEGFAESAAGADVGSARARLDEALSEYKRRIAGV